MPGIRRAWPPSGTELERTYEHESPSFNTIRGVGVSAEGAPGARRGLGEFAGTARLEIRFAPIAWLTGIGFAGYGIAGFLGAGVGLMLPTTTVFIGALLDPTEKSWVDRGRRPKKTPRHRWLLWSDQLGRKWEAAKARRRDRQEAEKRFLEARRKREGR
jgi:hypothetical protein